VVAAAGAGAGGGAAAAPPGVQDAAPGLNVNEAALGFILNAF